MRAIDPSTGNRVGKGGSTEKVGSGEKGGSERAPTYGARLVEDVLELLLSGLVGDVAHEDRPEALVHQHVPRVVHAAGQGSLCKWLNNCTMILNIHLARCSDRNHMNRFCTSGG